MVHKLRAVAPALGRFVILLGGLALLLPVSHIGLRVMKPLTPFIQPLFETGFLVLADGRRDVPGAAATVTTVCDRGTSNASIGHRSVENPIQLEAYIYQRLARALERFPVEDRADTYVVSLFEYNDEDDLRRPTITVGYNTERQVASTRTKGEAGAGRGAAHNRDDARWHYAFWLQNAVDVLFSRDIDPGGYQLLESYARQRGTWYSDEEEEEDFDGVFERIDPLYDDLDDALTGAVKRLHGCGDIERTFGRRIPVLIHGIEYYKALAGYNVAINPPGLVDGFARWIDEWGTLE